MINKIKAIVGEKHFEEFLNVVSFNYPPGSWEEYWKNEITDMAELCAMWHNDKTVLEAREIADTLSGIEFMRNPKFGIQTPAQYNNVISDFPRWDKYSDTSSLLYYARKIVDKYSDELTLVKNEQSKIKIFADDAYIMGAADDEDSGYFEANAEDIDGNTYTIRWDILPEWKKLSPKLQADNMDEACDWDSPNSVVNNDTGEDITGKAVISDTPRERIPKREETKFPSVNL